MPVTPHSALLIAALICVFCAVINRPPTSQVPLGWLGVFFLILDLMIGR